MAVAGVFLSVCIVGLFAALGVFIRDWLVNRRRVAALMELERYLQHYQSRAPDG